MTKIKTLAIDDEPLALQLVSAYIQKTPFLELTATFDNPISALEFLETNQVDLLLLDIQMPDLKGTSMARSLIGGPKIIFTTAFEKYAIESYKLDAVDYLLKPFGYEDFLLAVQKAKKLIELEQKQEQTVNSDNKFLFLKADHKIRRINFDDIMYIESEKDYVKVFIRNESKAILSLTTLKSIESKLPTTIFMRVHRSFIVNLNQIHTIDRFRIVFDNTYIPIGEQYRDAFQEFIDKNFL